MMTADYTEKVPLEKDKDGAIRVGGTRVLLDILIKEFNSGSTPEQIIEDYDTLQLADVYSVVGYYLHHKEEVDTYIRERKQEADEIRKKIEANQDLTAVRERLLERKQQLKQR